VGFSALTEDAVQDCLTPPNTVDSALPTMYQIAGYYTS
jgi:hypothetical protein